MRRWRRGRRGSGSNWRSCCGCPSISSGGDRWRCSFQQAMSFPTAALTAAGTTPPSRDPVAVNALPGDRFDLAPASSRDLGEEVWRAHIAWGMAKARQVGGKTP